MRYSVHLQKRAQDELEGIVSYLASFGPNTANSFIAEWRRKLEFLQEGTVEYRLSRFSLLAELGYHSFLVGNYVALFYVDDGDIFIAHVFHQSQDYASIVMHEVESH